MKDSPHKNTAVWFSDGSFLFSACGTSHCGEMLKSCTQAQSTDQTLVNDHLFLLMSSLQNPLFSVVVSLCPSHFYPYVLGLKRPAWGMATVTHFRGLIKQGKIRRRGRWKQKIADEVKQDESCLKDLQRIDGICFSQRKSRETGMLFITCMHENLHLKKKSETLSNSPKKNNSVSSIKIPVSDSVIQNKESYPKSS